MSTTAGEHVVVDRPRIVYAREHDLGIAEFRGVLAESGLGTTRPTDDPDRLGRMLSAADVIMTARLDEPAKPLVGLARCVTDFVWCCYVSELAVARSVQGLGIGKGLLDALRHELGPKVSVILASVPDAVGFYERIGMPRLPHVFCYRREK